MDFFFFPFNLRTMLEVDFQYWCIYFETQKYKLTYFLSLLETFISDVFILKLRSIFELDFLNKLFCFKFSWIPEVYFISEKVDIDKVLVKYKQSIFLLFSVFISYSYFFLGSLFNKLYFYRTSRIWSINEVYLKYT